MRSLICRGYRNFNLILGRKWGIQGAFYSTHINPQIIDYYDRNRIILVVLPPHSTYRYSLSTLGFLHFLEMPIQVQWVSLLSQLLGILE
jgi:hypothetical protein